MLRRVGTTTRLNIYIDLLGQLSCFDFAASEDVRCRCILFFARICLLLVTQILTVTMLQLHCSNGVGTCRSEMLFSITANF